jgi:putative DNA primase/helicase
LQEIIDQFLSAMADTGLSPFSQSDIKADDKSHDYRLSSDAPNKKKGFYKLKIDGDFGVGYFGDWRIGESHSWHSKAPVKYTKEQREAFKSRIEKEKETQKIEQDGIWEERSKEAQDYLFFMSEAKAHPYLQDKGVKPFGIYIDGNDLIIPIQSNGKIWNYQTIKPDGTKLFMPQAKILGNYYEIKGNERIAIVEGFATGASVAEATGYTVIIAFNAGNLIHVARIIRENNLDAKIIICADNDHETTLKNGIKNNTGILKGEIAAKEINAKMVYPDFTTEDHKLSDFNDYFKKHGIIKTKDRILGKPSEAAKGVEKPHVSDSQPLGGDLIQDPDAGWERELRLDGKGNMIKNSSTNLLLVLSNHPLLKDVFKYDGFAKRILVRNCPPWENESSFKVRPVQDFDYIRLECFLEFKFGLTISRDKCAYSIESTACEEQNTFNPASDYFNSLEWDGVPRLDTWLIDYVSDGQQSHEYLSMVGRKFMCGLAGRAMQAGVKFDTMVILEGKQYAGKSFLSRILATINGEEYFLDDFKDIENKDALMKMQGKLIVEFPEISTLRKAEINDLKAFLSRNTDVFRPPYGRNTIEAPRQCVFIGTVNPEGGYLRDVTGNRRYWPVSCRDKIANDAIRDIVPQLHAEAAHLFKNGEQLWLNEYEYNLATGEQEKRVLNDVWIDKISDIVLGKDEVWTDAILAEMNIPTDRQTPQIQQRISQTMRSIGYYPCRIIVGTKRKRGFKKMQSNIELALNKEEEISW